jgi:hypothetical protein
VCGGGDGSEQVCKYIDMPLQHISNMTLLRMNRPPRQHTENLLNKLRERIPNLILRTTFISGFPGETEEVRASPQPARTLLAAPAVLPHRSAVLCP